MPVPMQRVRAVWCLACLLPGAQCRDSHGVGGELHICRRWRSTVPYECAQRRQHRGVS